MSVDAVRCLGVQVRYGGVTALDGVALDVAAGAMVAVLGASGSGKSTLLHAIAGLVPPSAGEIWLAGRQVAGPGRSIAPERRNVGLVFQDFALWPHLSALDTVAYPLRRGGRSRVEAQRTARALLEQLGLGHLEHRRPAQLSGGQQQRLGLARALARDPSVFLLDEPTAHLDTHLRAAFQDAVRERQAASGAAAVYATHDAGEALALADRVALIVDGRLVQCAAPHVVYAEPVSLATARLTGAYSLLADGVLVRPDWIRLGGPYRGRVAACAFRGTHTDYQLATQTGTVHMQLPGPPRLAVGDEVDWGITRSWTLPAADERTAQPSAVIAPG